MLFLILKTITVFIEILSNTTVFEICNKKNFEKQPNQHIRMISEGSCDTEDWSNEDENSALPSGIKYILKYNKQKQ